MKKMKKKGWILAGTAVVVIAAGFFIYQGVSSRAAASEEVQTGLISYGTVSTSTSGSGTVRSNQSSTINWQTSGTVDSVSASIGQTVDAGTELATLDDSTLNTSIIQAQADLIDAETAYDELLKPDPLKIAEAQIALGDAQKALDELKTPSVSALAQAELAVVNAKSDLDDAQAVVDKLGYGRASDETIASARAAYLLAQDKVERMQSIYEGTPGDSETDASKALALTNLESAKTEMRRALANLNWYVGEPTEEEIAEKKTALAVAQAAYTEAVEYLDTLKNPTEDDIALAEAKVEDAQEILDNAKNGASEDELTIAKTRVTIAEAELAKSRLAAPFTGTITNIDVLVGDIVSAGDMAFRIDDLSKLFVDLSVSEVDILQIAVGQEAELTFDAIPDNTYSGVVTKIGMVAASSQGVVNYPVTVQITNPDESIFPGMTAYVNIYTEKHENVMVVPSAAVLTTAGQRIVKVVYDGEQISVAVTVGLTSDSMTEVSSDQLREGDVVVLNGTTASSSTSTTQQGRQQFIEGGFPGGMGGMEMPAGGGIIP